MSGISNGNTRAVKQSVYVKNSLMLYKHINFCINLNHLYTLYYVSIHCQSKPLPEPPHSKPEAGPSSTSLNTSDRNSKPL